MMRGARSWSVILLSLLALAAIVAVGCHISDLQLRIREGTVARELNPAVTDPPPATPPVLRDTSGNLPVAP